MKRYIVWRLATLMLIGVLGFSSISFAEKGKWTKKADMPTVRNSHAACVVNGKVYVVGGWLTMVLPIIWAPIGDS
jgi:hypothetical protein